MIRFSCDSCGKAYAVKEELAGRKTKCRQCKSPIQVPKPPVEPEDEPDFDDEWDDEYDDHYDDDDEGVAELPTRSKKKPAKAKKSPKKKSASQPGRKFWILAGVGGLLGLAVLGTLGYWVLSSALSDPVQARLMELAVRSLEESEPELSSSERQPKADQLIVQLHAMLKKEMPWSTLLPEADRQPIPDDKKSQFQTMLGKWNTQTPAENILGMRKIFDNFGTEVPGIIRMIFEDIDAGRQATSIDAEIVRDLGLGKLINDLS